MAAMLPFHRVVSVVRPIGAWAMMLACASAASAQTPRVDGPFSGLFGGQSQNRDVTQSLDLRGAVYGVWQDVLSPSSTVLREVDPRYQASGTFGVGSGSVDYMYRRAVRRSAFFVNGYAAAADYSVLPESIPATYRASAGLSSQFSQKVVFSAGGYASYAPFYNFGSTGVAAPPTNLPILVNGSLSSVSSIGGGTFDQTLPGSNFGIASIYEPSVNLGANTSATATLSPRSSLSMYGDYRYVALTDVNATGSDLYSAGVTFRHGLTRHLTLRLGYRYELDRYHGSVSQDFNNSQYEIGLDYGDAFTLPLGRRTTLSVAPSLGVSRWNNGTHFRVNGVVTLLHSFGRSWSGSASYMRDMGFDVGFLQPVLTDTVQLSLGGMLSHRVRWTTLGSWARGQIGFNSDAQYTWYTASSSVSYAIKRQIAAFAQYGYYVYDVPVVTAALFTFPHFERQAVSVGVTFFLPVFSSTKVHP
jgi:hypothetical protein